ncbi:ThiF family adenylyltransferase [Pukyongiella litopenaei]|uniref:HesA/MoeB/ThiF family protein n=1 Tax=Pukyongiella litopenaei TaxID=2605946 RepID=A0A2S0MS56_9RHOB|nr:ThiF family adenylyltransferase [Pukyongiella litopenaei]AVO38714.1 HesA/MoeB/ThiF family protein [Pukyongiella litopenaei]
MTRYARQTCLPGIGPGGQARLAAARVLVVGAGGLGAALLPLLAGAGVGYLRLIDPDVVEASNLHRQTLFRMSDLGRAKAEVAAETLAGLNPDCEISPCVARLDPVSARGELAGADLVIDAADSFAVTYALSDLCHAAARPLISASVLARQGYVGGFCGGAPSLRAVFPDLPGRLGSCATNGVMGPVVATLGAVQAQMALAVLLDHDPSPLGQLLSMDLATWRLTGFRFDGAAEPATPTPAILSRSQVAAGDLVIDLRENQLPAPAPRPDQRVVFVCSTGLRAWRAARALGASGHAAVAIIGDGA